MKSEASNSSEQTETIRALPFFFSGRFFLLFGCSSIMLVPVYLAFPMGIAVPVALDAVLLLLAFLDFFSGPSPSKIRIERPIPYPLAVDRPTEVSLEVANLTGMPVSLIIQDDCPSECRTQSLPIRSVVRAGSGTRLQYKLTPLERGNAEFGNISFWLKGSLGLVWKRGQSPAARTIKFYPGLALIEKRRLQVRRPSADGHVRALKKHGEGTEFESLREYAVGDDSRLIHWGTTARKGKMIVRRNRMEQSQNVFLVLDAGRMMTARVMGKTKLDHSLNAALMLAYGALELGDKVGVMVVGQDVRVFLPPAKTIGQFGRILDATYALPPKMEEPRFYRALSGISARLKRRSLVVIFTDLIDERASEGLMRYSLALLPRHLPLVVALSDTELVALADRIPEEKQDLYRQGVAAEMLDRRERFLARLSSVGVMTLDTPADQISVAVLDRYLDIKTRNLL